VVSVFDFSPGDEGSVTSACEYSSETGEWGELSLGGQFPFLSMKPPTLVENSLYFACGFEYILEYNLAARGLVTINLPEMIAEDANQKTIFLMTESGRLGIAEVVGLILYLWFRDVTTDDEEGWILSRAIDLDKLFPAAAHSASCTVEVIGYAKEANTIFLCTIAGVFTVELNSEQAKKVYEFKLNEMSFVESGTCNALFPFCSFYIPGTTHSLNRDI
jgi:hypothetical protein